MGKQNQCNGGKEGDIETGHTPAAAALYPNMAENPSFRWAFIRKVYSIILIQLLLTVAVASAFIFVRPISVFLFAGTPVSWAVLILIIIAPLITMFPMFYFQERHPINVFLLGLFTIFMACSIGLACATKSGKVVLEAAVLTIAVVVAITLYTFWAAKRGYDFNFLGPFLTAAILILLIYWAIQIFFPLGKIGQTIYGFLGSIIFSGFILYDTDNLIKRYTYDQYISAAIALYLDIINLFTSILSIFSGMDS
ncbi:protein LIFEGUARD 4-like [Dioscorea cayenensis subsp. rotundata]|uniref:Protein LIFEGUARD 4-like n=1 Tax=Dioscorea cayennensis subsp. rotundata TaxID=55577 RepID=A0AB40CL57_DIOCR|nr:protein LIFEGUARD 4-like [Dioscorea cayenensis subsp. rotundata]